MRLAAADPGRYRRYLRVHLDANLDRLRTVRQFRDALRRLVVWLAEAHLKIINPD